MAESFEQRHVTLIREFNEFLVYVHVDALAPRRSRLVNPQLRLVGQPRSDKI